MKPQRYPVHTEDELAPKPISIDEFESFSKDLLIDEDYTKPKEGKDQSISVKVPKEKPAPVAKSVGDRFGKEAEEILKDVESVPKTGPTEKKFGHWATKISKNPAESAYATAKKVGGK